MKDWEDLWDEFISDCKKANKKTMTAGDFFFWLDFGFKVPEPLDNIIIEEQKTEKELTEDQKFMQNHKIGDEYQMDGKPDKWKIAYYPILEDAKTNEKYDEPRALVEKPIKGGTDFREIPLRYLTKIKLIYNI
jgi:hypothetical protein